MRMLTIFFFNISTTFFFDCNVFTLYFHGSYFFTFKSKMSFSATFFAFFVRTQTGDMAYIICILLTYITKFSVIKVDLLGQWILLQWLAKFTFWAKTERRWAGCLSREIKQRHGSHLFEFGWLAGPREPNCCNTWYCTQYIYFSEMYNSMQWNTGII